MDGETDHATRAVIYSRDGDDHLGRCLAWCAERGYDLDSVIAADPGDRWREVITLMASGQVDVVVVPDRDQLAPARAPRVETVGDTSGPGRSRRPRRRR